MVTVTSNFQLLCYSGVKMVNQLLAGVHIASGAEAMAFGARLGLNTRILFDVILNSQGTSWYTLIFKISTAFLSDIPEGHIRYFFQMEALL